ncbi:hypothetical protein ABMA28_012312 [Loxostege sticticalis]|uniref:Uncharacterized protein n=1 Tax=Loxostege sticticalis TaxID=481309 RepID=A0ABD0TMP3_LOXSC
MYKQMKTCRICLRVGSRVEKNCKSLFATHNCSTISGSITLIANVKIQQDDGFPSIICGECLEEFDAAIIFKEKCERSNKLLHSGSQFEEIKTTSTAIAELPIPIELVKKEDVSEHEEQYEEIDCYEDAESDLEIKSELHGKHIKIPSLVLPEPNFEESETNLTTSELNQPVISKSKAIDLNLECHDCGGLFKSKCKLRVHWKKVHMLEKLICTFCKRNFKCFSTYHNHLKKRPRNCLLASKTRIEGIGKSRVFYCKHCSFHSKRPNCFFNHLNIHTGERPFICKLCSKGFAQLSALHTHKENVHKLIRKEITCQYCGELVRGRHRIQRHLEKHTSGPLQCDICKKMYKTKSTLIEHLKHHTGVKPFTCEKCASSFYTRSSLLTHRRVVHRTSRLIYKCDTCGFKFASSVALKRHKIKHTIFNEMCDVCGRFYPNSEELASHKKAHTKEKSVCLECNRIFCNERSLKRHKATTHKHKQNLDKEKSVNLTKNMIPMKRCKNEKVEVEIIPILQ